MVDHVAGRRAVDGGYRVGAARCGWWRGARWGLVSECGGGRVREREIRIDPETGSTSFGEGRGLVGGELSLSPRDAKIVSLARSGCFTSID
jgi:hypothetical protein